MATRVRGKSGSKRKGQSPFTAIFERDGKFYIGYCPEVPGANGQGDTLAQCRQSLREAIKLILEDRREDALRGVPPDAVCEPLDVA